MKRKLSFIFIMLLLSLPAFSQETFTLTTYYPAPFGVYSELRSRRMAIGDNYFQQSVHPWATISPNPAPDVQISQNADLVVEDNLGIGTTDPRVKLDVVGAMHLHNANARNRGLLYTAKSDEYPTYEEEFVMTIHDGSTGTGDDKSSIFIGPDAAGATAPRGRVEVAAKEIYLAAPGSGGTAQVAVGKRHSQEIYATLDVAGGVRVGIAGTCGDNSTGCNANTAGTMRYCENMVQHCDGTNWKSPVVASCIRYRSSVVTKDSVAYCPSTFPRVFSCNGVDDSAPALSGGWDSTDIGSEKGGGCQTTGLCDMDGRRDGLGVQQQYFETVHNAQGTEGCLSYDYGHNHYAYRLEILCCKN